ncbi:MAG: nucleoside phosphorylase [Anaerolineales bacterium]|nr:nucleoside phosphorylase [Anaerolineales bacterium]
MMSEPVPLPQTPAKYAEKALLEPAALLAHRQRLGQGPLGPAPAGLLLAFQPDLLKQLMRKQRGKALPGFFGEAYRLRRTGGQVMAMGNFGVGAPAAAAVLEDAIAFGVGAVVAIGIAGGLLPGQAPGDLLLIDRALRDEGTSRHYLPPARFAVADPDLTGRLAASLQQQQLPFQQTASWTTDAPYRETRLEADEYAQAGCAAVEMELAALFAVGQFRQIPVAGLLVVADSLREDGWQLAFPWAPVLDRLAAAAQATLELWRD